MSNIIYVFFVALFLAGVANASPIAESVESLGVRSEASGFALTGDFTCSTDSWTTEGSGGCSTGAIRCPSGREIGCQASGVSVSCQLVGGEIGWVRCESRTGGSSSVFEDQCS
ncbi:MAG: hypothetical protein HYR96_02150 [Deltaproteobacteria bacterium]|nr:hypothetical protein [Deltaproteobacteria bacterium]MBI3293386.1 hypothetical protein [Deltaproteobacteria bacterium]